LQPKIRGGLPIGVYAIGTDADDSYHYEQYLALQSKGRWEFVEYGYVPSTKTLCQITRQKGTYHISGDTAFVMHALAGGHSMEDCPITKEKFQAYPFIAASENAEATMPIRNIKINGFEAKDLFVGFEGWKTYTQTADPFGMLE
jgi:hypothetical protein